MKIGARNRILGKVTAIERGSLMCMVKVEVPASAKLASVMTLESVEELGLQQGDQVEVVVKAVNVLLMKD